MYYKLLKNETVVDVLNQLIYLKYDERLKMMVNSDINQANAILSSIKIIIGTFLGCQDHPLKWTLLNWLRFRKQSMKN